MTTFLLYRAPPGLVATCAYCTLWPRTRQGNQFDVIPELGSNLNIRFKTNNCVEVMNS